MIDLVLVALATWYVAYALTSTDGPGDIFWWIRENVWHCRTKKIMLMASEGEDIRTVLHNGLLDCPVCLSFWAALILLLVPMGIVVQALALAGAAMLLHGLAGWRFRN